ncbi:sulfatase family protein [Membranihabitans marinus]|uniref:sulfatase family protein n=1 Tax=Membranihabitans marinus TaxID=1227546 RepID=UPI001F2B3E18|nr:sulfatase [Membranihabitans marinus]
MRYLLFAILILTFFQCKKTNENTDKPNVIVFFVDDLGYGDIGTYGAKGYTTPHLDSLAELGLKFTEFYVPATVCTPSRAGLLTGKYPKRLDLHEAVLFPYSQNGLDTSTYTMAELFKDHGYTTSCIGKWHLGHLPQYMPNQHGFDHFFGVPYSNDMNNHYYKRIDFQAPPLPMYRNQTKIEDDPDQRYLTKRYTEETIAQIKNRDGKPFFIYLAHNMPHLPLYVSEAFEGKSELGLYGDVIMELDWSMGQIVKTLKEEGIFENTIVVFTSDNGPVLRVDGSAGELRGQKAETWEGGQRVPCIITWPKHIPANHTIKSMTSTLDLFPTFAHILDSTSTHNNDGHNILSLLKNPSQDQLEDYPFLYYARNGEVEAIRYGKWKLHIKKSRGWVAKRDGTFEKALYDLSKDIDEENNLAPLFPEKVKELEALIIKTDGVISSKN